MITTIIVEDDPIFRDVLLDLLPKSSIKTKILASCASLKEAKEAIKNHEPKLLLLDIELPDGKTMELLDELDINLNCETIFITSHDQYAIDAIKKDAADYIMKPATLSEINFALQRVEKRLAIYEKLLLVTELKAQVEKLNNQNLQENSIMINTHDGVVFIKVKEILKLESESNYTIIYLQNNKKIVASKTLSVFEEMLQEFNFMRIHRSFLINLTKVETIKNENNNYYVVLHDESMVEISRRKKKDFFEKIAYGL